MVDSVNNATGVLATLRYLQAARGEMDSADARLSSGKKVDHPRDDATAYHTAAMMSGEGGSLKAVSLSLSRAESVSDTAIAAAEQISKLLIEMKATATAAMQEDLSIEQRQAYDDAFQNQKKQLDIFLANARFDDANLLDGSRPAGLIFVADADANQTVTLKGRDFRMGGPVIDIPPDQAITGAASARAVFEQVSRSIANVGDQLTQMAGESKRVTAQIGFIGKLADALAAGVSRLVDADLAAESALIQALQVKQQLSAQALSIVNNAPQSLLQLFKN